MGEHPAIMTEHQGPSREVLRNAREQIIGTLERQHLTGRVLARDRSGRVVGHYDEHRHETRDAAGRLVGSGNLLPMLLRS